MRLVVVSFLCLFLYSGCAGGVGVRDTGETSAEKRERGGGLLSPLLLVIKKHREETTHMDGPRCPMYPSCAAWAEKAIRRHSFLGLLLFIDRLFFRETGALSEKYFVAPRRFSGHLRFYDPLEDTLPLFEGKRPSLYAEEF